MDHIINVGVPHIGENIFSNLNDRELIHCLSVSKTWFLIGNQIFLKRFAELDYEEGRRKLLVACQYGNAEVVKLLLSRMEPNAVSDQDSSGMTPLMVACEYGNTAAFKFILDLTGDAFWRLANFFLPHLDQKGRIKCNAMTAFVIACKKGHADLVQLMLNKVNSDEFYEDKTYSINSRSDGLSQFTLGFILAQESFHGEVIRVLFSHGRRQSALSLVCNLKSETLIKFVMNNALLLYLDVNARDQNGQTALMRECQSGNIFTVQTMLENVSDASGFFDFNARDPDGNTAFMLACRSGHTELVRLLLFYADSGFDIQLNLINKENKSAIQMAVEYGRAEVVQTLLQQRNITLPNMNDFQKLRSTSGHLFASGEPLLYSSTQTLTIAQNIKELLQQHEFELQVEKEIPVASTTETMEDEEMSDTDASNEAADQVLVESLDYMEDYNSDEYISDDDAIME